MALDLTFRGNAASLARRSVPFALAAMVGMSHLMTPPAHAAEGAKPAWSALKSKPDFAAAECLSGNLSLKSLGFRECLDADFERFLMKAAFADCPKMPIPSTKCFRTDTERTPIPKEHCNYLYDRIVVELKKNKNILSLRTRKSLGDFYAFENRLPTCTGPREIAWERGDDYDTIIALADSATVGFDRKIDFRLGYGFRPAARPTTVVPGPGADAGAPKVN